MRLFGLVVKACRTRLARVTAGYLRFSCHRPGLLLLLWTVASLAVIAVGLLTLGLPALETDAAAGSYLRSDGVISDRHDILAAALAQEKKRQASDLENGRRLGEDYSEAEDDEIDELRRLATEEHVGRRLSDGASPQQGFPQWYVDVYFEVASERTIFSDAALDDMRDFEARMEALPSYSRFCFVSGNSGGQCRKLKSSMLFFHGEKHPVTAKHSPFSAYYVMPNGRSEERNDVDAVVSAMAMSETWPQLGNEDHARLWYFDRKFPNSKLMRIRAHFGLPLEGFRSHLEDFDAQTELYRKFIEEEVYPLLSTASTENVKVYYDGPVLKGHEVFLVILGDAKKAGASLVLVYTYMAVYTKAPLVALLGMCTVIMSIPLGTVFYAALGHDTLPAINFLVLFLLTGIGADHIFILMDTWRQTKRESSNLQDRLQSTFGRAGRSIAACGTTTAVSFLANLLSSVRPLRWFGLFVGLCILSNLVLSLGMFPPVLLLREKTKKYWRRRKPKSPLQGTDDTSPGQPDEAELGPMYRSSSTERPQSARSGTLFGIGKSTSSRSEDKGLDSTVVNVRPATPVASLSGLALSRGMPQPPELDLMASMSPPPPAPPAADIEVSSGTGGSPIRQGFLADSMADSRLRSPDAAQTATPQSLPPDTPSGGVLRGLLAPRDDTPSRVRRNLLAFLDPPPQESSQDDLRAAASTEPEAPTQRPAPPAPPVEKRGRAIPHDRLERLFGDHYAPCLYRCRHVVVLVGFVIAVLALVLVSKRLRPSREFPTFFAPGTHNLGDVSSKQSAFGNHAWATDMERVALRICENCNWDQDCSWGAWSHWTDCNVPCGVGERTRWRRTQKPPGPGGSLCSGGTQEHTLCELQDCNANCVWGAWTHWSQCSSDCGTGMRNRTRVIAAKARGTGLPCGGDALQWRNCGSWSCDLRCTVSEWSFEADCSATCGPGVQTMKRHVPSDTEFCQGEIATRTVPCHAAPCSNECKFGSWEDAPGSVCSSTCGRGWQRQVRSTVANEDGYVCTAAEAGLQERVVSCFTGICISEAGLAHCAEANYDPWSEWSHCPHECRPALRRRVRVVPHGCSGEGEQLQACNLTACPDECRGRSWMSMGDCDATCGSGLQREVLVGSSSSGGGLTTPLLDECPTAREVPCRIAECPVDCVLGPWTAVGECSVQCEAEGVEFEIRPVLRWSARGGVACPPEEELRREVRCDRTVVPCFMVDPNRGPVTTTTVPSMAWSSWPLTGTDGGRPADGSPATDPSLALQLVLHGLEDGSVGLQAADVLRVHLADILGIQPEDVGVLLPSGSGQWHAEGGGRRLQMVPVAVSVNSEAEESDLAARLQAAVASGDLAARLRDEDGFAGLSHVTFGASEGSAGPTDSGLEPLAGGPEEERDQGSREPLVSLRKGHDEEAPGKDLADSEVAVVAIVIGLKEEPKGRSVSSQDFSSVAFDSAFDFSRPSAQLALMRLCSELENARHELAVRRVDCFAEPFRRNLEARSESFPTSPGSQVHERLASWLEESKNSGGGRLWQNYVGFVGDPTAKPQVQWLQVRVVTDLPWKMAAADAWRWAERWDNFVNEENYYERNGPSSGARAKNRGLGMIFHTSRLWVRAETEIRLVNSTLFCACLSVFFAMITMLFFLGNFAIAMYLMCGIICVVLCLAALMFGIFGWPFGAVEAVGLIIVVGFSVDYSLHIAESYSLSTCETRFEKVQDALRRTGGALCGAAATSVLACPPILFCTIRVFVKFGILLIANMVLSLVISLTFFAALLSVVGPMDDFGSFACVASVCSCSGRSSSKLQKFQDEDGPVEEVVGYVVQPPMRDTTIPLPTSPPPAYRWAVFDDDDGTGKPMKKGSATEEGGLGRSHSEEDGGTGGTGDVVGLPSIPTIVTAPANRRRSAMYITPGIGEVHQDVAPDELPRPFTARASSPSPASAQLVGRRS
eukprot:TRINITY_DN90300_c0_g1_i1.p1 TRINITY_DN90300_c0_g1~~TRINITY_DN90300_c0_g1_i1.p1  ORF type:complete len:1938 (+),score=383.34 TRINITY_DN90300_c0_g1_i1:179-5992(+)